MAKAGAICRECREKKSFSGRLLITVDNHPGFNLLDGFISSAKKAEE